jgi:hypothetical protein
VPEEVDGPTTSITHELGGFGPDGAERRNNSRGLRAWKRGSSTAVMTVGGGEGGVGQQRRCWVHDRLVRVGEGAVRHGPPVSMNFRCFRLEATYAMTGDGVRGKGIRGMTVRELYCSRDLTQNGWQWSIENYENL